MKRILICDDQPLITSYLAEILTTAGFASTALSDSTRVIPTLEGGEFDLLILDREMPELRADDILPMLRVSEKPCRDIPVILHTGSWPVDLEPDVRDDPRLRILVKPSSVREVVATVRACTHS